MRELEDKISHQAGFLCIKMWLQRERPIIGQTRSKVSRDR